MRSSPLDPDRLGTIASTICAIHCAVTGLAVSVLSVIGFATLQSPYLEWGFLGLALVFGSWAAYRGYAIHKSWIPVIVFFFGLLLLLGSHLVDPKGTSGMPSGFMELFSVLGGICLISFHYINRRRIKAMKGSC